MHAQAREHELLFTFEVHCGGQWRTFKYYQGADVFDAGPPSTSPWRLLVRCCTVGASYRPRLPPALTAPPSGG